MKNKQTKPSERGMKRTYFYLHTNGELIEKPAIVVESEGVQSYFSSPFVRKYWVATTEEDLTRIKKEAEVLKKMGQEADGFKFDQNYLSSK